MVAKAKIAEFLGKMRYRILVYLAISATLFYVLAFTSGEASVAVRQVLAYIDWVGIPLLFLFYGPPAAWFGGGSPTGIVPQFLYAAGIFFEFLMIELVNLLRKYQNR